MKNNRITRLFGIDFPIISGGMVWCSGYKLATAVSNAGGLGLMGAGSMYPEVLREHIQKAKKATDLPFGVNVPLMYPDMEEVMKIIMDEHVPVVFTSAGNPKTWTKTLQAEGIKVAHVVSSVKFALKSQDAGVDAVVAEGFEAGGHNGREETTTMCLIPSVADAIEIPLIAAGGIGSGRAMAAALCLGADGVQIGSAFALTEESSAHDNFKKKSVSLSEGETMLLLKKLSPTRMILNDFAQEVISYEDRGATKEELATLLGRGRSKKGIFEGDLSAGELEIGQVAYQLNEIVPVAPLFDKIKQEYFTTIQKFQS
ncbi:NAD(P)H-dependent flavin oxidoreductase [Porphyromonas canoris]|uniref:2-nitropropane dioxygenase n=1 Tax=Porphyromonas canoris TaxID=36875 RepID=A0ABR4XNB3_9PORP|nr:nitronate monooxygenase [Porphyromonas canoris]KGN93420.1 2-nitropropane dioxygenase [Porphyromonas canoris]